jgi:conjugal transfer pilus assembly protein TraK
LIAFGAVASYAAESNSTPTVASSSTTVAATKTPIPTTKGARKTDFYASSDPVPEKRGKSASKGEVKGKKGSQVDDGKDDDGEMKDLALPQASQDGIGEQSLLPEVQMKAMFSASDVNRVVCGTDIKDVTFSKEKGIMVKYSGKNAFVKFAVTKLGEKTLYAVNPVEMFVVCGESVFNIIAIPKRIPSQTIRLTSGKKERIQKNNAVHAGQSFEKKLLEIIKSTYTDDFPESYTVTSGSKEINSFRDATILLKREIEVEGEGIVVHEYHVSPKDLVGQLVINERDFMKEEFCNRPLAISADKLTLRKGEVARVFVIDTKEANNVERP